MTSKDDVPRILMARNERGATQGHTVKPMKLFLAHNERGTTRGHTVKPMKQFLARNERGTTTVHTVKGMKLEAPKCLLLKKSNQCIELPPAGRGYGMNSGRLQFQTKLCMGELSHFVRTSTDAQTQPSAEKTENRRSMQFFIDKIDIYIFVYMCLYY